MDFLPIGLVWLASGFLGYGFAVAHFQREFPEMAHESRVSDRLIPAILILLGPINLIASAIHVGFSSKFRHGWML